MYCCPLLAHGYFCGHEYLSIDKSAIAHAIHVKDVTKLAGLSGFKFGPKYNHAQMPLETRLGTLCHAHGRAP